MVFMPRYDGLYFELYFNGGFCNTCDKYRKKKKKNREKVKQGSPCFVIQKESVKVNVCKRKEKNKLSK